MLPHGYKVVATTLHLSGQNSHAVTVVSRAFVSLSKKQYNPESSPWTFPYKSLAGTRLGTQLSLFGKLGIWTAELLGLVGTCCLHPQNPDSAGMEGKKRNRGGVDNSCVCGNHLLASHCTQGTQSIHYLPGRGFFFIRNTSGLLNKIHECTGR